MPRRKRKTRTEPAIEIDFHGWRAEEVYSELTDLVNRYAGKGGTQIRVIHGKGAGILASEVERFARNDPRVASAEKDFFNPGITTLILNGCRDRVSPPDCRTDWDFVPEPRPRKRKR